MKNKEKFKGLVSPNTSNTIERSKSRIRNREVLKESRKIAFKILEKLNQLGWTQKQLAEKMGVSPQQVNKLVKGKENITLETQIKIQNILEIPILATCYEHEKFEVMKTVMFAERRIDYPLNQYVLHGKEFGISVFLNNTKALINIKIDANAYLGETNHQLQPTG